MLPPDLHCFAVLLNSQLFLRPVQEPDEHFTLSLSEPHGGGTLLEEASHTTRITIINDVSARTSHAGPRHDVWHTLLPRDRNAPSPSWQDFPGVFHFPDEDIKVKDSEKEVQIPVYRLNGCSGTVSLNYRTLDGSATGGNDYTSTVGTLTWKHADVAPQSIVVPLVEEDEEGNSTASADKRYFEVRPGQAEAPACSTQSNT